MESLNAHRFVTLTPEERAQLNRKAVRNVMSFVAIKVALYACIALFARRYRKKYDTKHAS